MKKNIEVLVLTFGIEYLCFSPNLAFSTRWVSYWAGPGPRAFSRADSFSFTYSSVLWNLEALFM